MTGYWIDLLGKPEGVRLRESRGRWEKAEQAIHGKDRYLPGKEFGPDPAENNSWTPSLPADAFENSGIIFTLISLVPYPGYKHFGGKNNYLLFHFHLYVWGGRGGGKQNRKFRHVARPGNLGKSNNQAQEVTRSELKSHSRSKEALTVRFLSPTGVPSPLI